jgi:hypothetical protein
MSSHNFGILTGHYVQNSWTRLLDNGISSYNFPYGIQMEGIWRYRKSGHRNDSSWSGTKRIGSYIFILGTFLGANSFIARYNSLEPLAPDIVLPFLWLQPLLGHLGQPRIVRIFLSRNLEAPMPMPRPIDLVTLRRNLGLSSLHMAKGSDCPAFF